MPPTSRYLSRILHAAERSVTATQLARVLDVPVNRAAQALRYWEKAGYLLPHVERSVIRHGRKVKARYSLTPKGQAALSDERHETTRHGTPQQPQQPTGD